ncbi:hypothetical protein Sgly_0747 [Syntrophobotulus glycolicus DSM 8271]|uniref:Uncharacterized protein n=1 Tax=Syntrophobotulus glycolicus (strain DSM 8271 / FlGlyR) TaxID=645991 RepID=F0T0N9_SYNGF|nr:hypothetical protein [Syntrophobotulus glycolicus]ADY55104.1 hypothetical protein Sgly_0747 [Syntrophobotulus glycolicus DSM 8271]
MKQITPEQIDSIEVNVFKEHCIPAVLDEVERELKFNERLFFHSKTLYSSSEQWKTVKSVICGWTSYCFKRVKKGEASVAEFATCQGLLEEILAEYGRKIWGEESQDDCTIRKEHERGEKRKPQAFS